MAYTVRIGSYYANSHPIKTIYVTGSDDYCASELVISTKANDIGTLEMAIPPQNVEYTDIEKSDKTDWYGLGSYIEVLQDQDEANPLWNGIITGITKDMFGQLRITAYDMISTLKYQMLPTRTFINEEVADLLSWLVSHNNVDEGSGDPINENYKIKFNHPFANNEKIPELKTDGKTTFDALQDLCESAGAWFTPIYEPFMRKDLYDNPLECVEIRILTEGSAGFTQRIQLGWNMLEFSSLNTTDGWLTSIAPISEDGNGNTINITSVSGDGSGYLKIDPDIIAKYGERRERVKFEGITDPYELMGYGMHYLATHAFPDFSINVSAVDMSMLGINVDEFQVGYMTKVKISPFGLETSARITEKTIDCMNPEQTKITISNYNISSMTQGISKMIRERRNG